jgi:hypothetical protein
MHFRRQRDILLTLQERRSRLTLARRPLGKDGPGRQSHRRGTAQNTRYGLDAPRPALPTGFQAGLASGTRGFMRSMA